MSSIYVLEPPTKGKVILNTTVGPLDIELWPKETPKAVRNFVQLCLEGYYNNTIFHRIIKTFMVQGGDSTGTGSGGESIYGAPFADEIHSRLRFKHRGLVACANAGDPNSNNSQFFITLDRCDWLDRKHTIFGKVTGESIFNLLKLGDIETDKDDRPIDSPPKIISVEVLWNPFDDIIPRQASKKSEPISIEELSRENKKKTVKRLNLLSFGDEAEEEQKVLAAVKEKIKSSHDVLNDPRLLKEASEMVELDRAPNDQVLLTGCGLATMVKGPGLFSDIGKKSRDLLYKDFLVDQKFSLTTYTPTGLVFTSTGTKKGELFLGDLTTQLKNKNVTTDIKVDTSSNLFATVTIDEPTPGLKAILSFTVPDQRSGKVELQYLHDYAGISTSIGLTATPVVETSVVIGNESVALGGEFAFDTASSNFTKYNAGLNFVQPDFISSLNLTDRGDTLKASYLHIVSPLTKTAVGAEIAHSISRNENIFTMGTQHAFDPFTTVKARLNNHGKIAALVQHEWRPKSLITLSGEVDSKALDNSSKIGLSLVLKP